MLIHPKQPDPAPVPTYLLTPASGFIDPCLFNDFTNGRNVRAVRLGWSTYHPAVVGDGRRVVVETDRASDTFRIDGDLPPGTPVLVWLERNFRCAVEADLRAEHEREQAAADARRAEAEERWRHRRENEKQEALRFNATIRLPVKWDVGIKAVRSGLSASSSGDGCKANTVFHIHLPEGLQAGRLHRVENHLQSLSRPRRQAPKPTGRQLRPAGGSTGRGRPIQKIAPTHKTEGLTHIPPQHIIET